MIHQVKVAENVAKFNNAPHWKTGFRSKRPEEVAKKAFQLAGMYSETLEVAQDEQGYYHIYVAYTDRGKE